MPSKICYYLKEVDAILAGEKVPPVTCEIDPTNYCQNKCRFCYFEGYLQHTPMQLNYDLYLRLISDLQTMGVKSVTFTGGGEPTLHPRFKSMVRDAKRRGFALGLITNGLKIDDTKDLLDHFDFIRVSLNAATPETYYELTKNKDGFEKVRVNLATLSLARRRGLTVGISYVICPENQHEVELAEKMANDIGVDYIQFKPEVGNGLPRNEHSPVALFTDRYPVDSDLPCKIAGLVGIVGADGQAYFCCQKRGDSAFVVGDLRTTFFPKVWAKRKGMKPDISGCTTCRYMNYAVDYREYVNPKYSFLRHREFL